MCVVLFVEIRKNLSAVAAKRTKAYGRSTAAQRMHDFDSITVFESTLGMQAFGDDLAIDFNRNLAPGKAGRFQQLNYGATCDHIAGFAIEKNAGHALIVTPGAACGDPVDA